jgi:hypothetical protein
VGRPTHQVMPTVPVVAASVLAAADHLSEAIAHALVPISYAILVAMLAHLLCLHLHLVTPPRQRVAALGWATSPVVTTRVWLHLARTGTDDPVAARALFQQLVRLSSRLPMVCRSSWPWPFGPVRRARTAALQVVRDGLLTASQLADLLPAEGQRIAPAVLLAQVDQAALHYTAPARMTHQKRVHQTHLRRSYRKRRERMQRKQWERVHRTWWERVHRTRGRQSVLVNGSTAACLAAEPGADAERRAELQVEAGKKARKNVTFLDATFSVQKSVTVLHTSFEAEEVKARRAAERARDALAAMDHGSGASGTSVADAPEAPGAADRLWAEAEDAERDAERWGVLRQTVEDAIWVGNRAAMDYLADKAGVARAGHHGGAAGRWLDAHDWTIASFFQHDSRNHDPQLHIHNAILNRVQCPDGKWRTLDGKSIYRFRGSAAAVGERVMEHRLTQTLGCGSPPGRTAKPARSSASARPCWTCSARGGTRSPLGPKRG